MCGRNLLLNTSLLSSQVVPPHTSCSFLYLFHDNEFGWCTAEIIIQRNISFSPSFKSLLCFLPLEFMQEHVVSRTVRELHSSILSWQLADLRIIRLCKIKCIEEMSGSHTFRSHLELAKRVPCFSQKETLRFTIVTELYDTRLWPQANPQLTYIWIHITDLLFSVPLFFSSKFSFPYSLLVDAQVCPLQLVS